MTPQSCSKSFRLLFAVLVGGIAGCSIQASVSDSNKAGIATSSQIKPSYAVISDMDSPRSDSITVYSSGFIERHYLGSEDVEKRWISASDVALVYARILSVERSVGAPAMTICDPIVAVSLHGESGLPDRIVIPQTAADSAMCRELWKYVKRIFNDVAIDVEIVR